MYLLEDLLYLLILTICDFRCFRPPVSRLARRPPWAAPFRFLPQLTPCLRDVLHVNKRLLSPGKDSALFSRSLSLKGPFQLLNLVLLVGSVGVEVAKGPLELPEC